MILPIVPYGNDILRQESAALEKGVDLDRFNEDLYETMINANGAGISAVQVERPISLFVINLAVALNHSKGESRHKDRQVFINARIVKSGASYSGYREGCLSIPTVFAHVERPHSIVVEYLDEKFIPHRQSYSGFIARIIQHEYDHTVGKLFIDYLSRDARNNIEGKLKLIQEGRLQGPYPMLY